MRNSMREGRGWSRLRPFRPMWSKIIKGSADFLGLNYYTSRYVETETKQHNEIPSFEHDANLKYTIDKKWRRAKSSWLYCVPQGLQGLLE